MISIEVKINGRMIFEVSARNLRQDTIVTIDGRRLTLSRYAASDGRTLKHFREHGFVPLCIQLLDDGDDEP